MHDHPQPDRDEQTNDPQRPTRSKKLHTRAKWAWIGVVFSSDLHDLTEWASQIHQALTNHQ